MAAAVCAVLLDDAVRGRLTTLARSRTASHQLVTRTGIVLAAADGVANAQIARQLQISEDTVRTWRSRFAADGLAGLDDRHAPVDRRATARTCICGSWPPSPGNCPKPTRRGPTS